MKLPQICVNRRRTTRNTKKAHNILINIFQNLYSAEHTNQIELTKIHLKIEVLQKYKSVS